MGKPLKRFKDWNRRRRTQLKLGVNERCAGRGAAEATPDLVVGIFCAMEIMWAAALVWGAASRDGRSPIRSGDPARREILHTPSPRVRGRRRGRLCPCPGGFH